ncbi:MAG: class I mannose-6-phosphate isomerase [Planctomycetes bacterium]|nr:class I mannose-6-phosphate isomerase [Planctomycetota bacterium]
MSTAALQGPRPTMLRSFAAYPLTFAPRLEERVWGGRGLERYGKAIPPRIRIGESWEVSDVEGRPSVVQAGPYRGQSLRDLLEGWPEEILGESAPGEGRAAARFPLLLKLLHAREDLSVQVHPSDADLRREGKAGRGKSEAWVILEAAEGARIACGLAPGVDRAAFFRRMREVGGGNLAPGEEASLLRWASVAPGDVVLVPAGTVHAVGGGIVLLEVQQTSDITYRIHDWGRPGKGGRPRELHLDEAERVAPAAPVPCPHASLEGAPEGRRFSPVLDAEHFSVEALALGPGTLAGRAHRATTAEADRPAFHILAGLEGAAACRGPCGEEVLLRPGRFALLPAALGDYALSADARARVLRFRGPRR